MRQVQILQFQKKEVKDEDDAERAVNYTKYETCKNMNEADYQDNIMEDDYQNKIVASDVRGASPN